MHDLEKLIPAPVTHNDIGERLPYWSRRFPRSEAYEAAARAVLPPGWELYMAVDAADHPQTCAWDFGAFRTDNAAHVFGIRELGGAPKRLCASVSREHGGAVMFFDPEQLGEACQWCETQLAARKAS